MHYTVSPCLTSAGVPACKTLYSGIELCQAVSSPDIGSVHGGLCAGLASYPCCTVNESVV